MNRDDENAERKIASEHDADIAYVDETKEWSRIVIVLLTAAVLAAALWILFSPPRANNPQPPITPECRCICEPERR